MTTNWILIGVLVVILVAFIFISMSRRKKDAEYRADLESKIIPGAKVKTYSGLYGTVVSVTDTTDGKIILIKTGDGANSSYQSLHINAIFGFDTKQPIKYDTQGNVILPKDLTSENKTAPVIAPLAAPAENKKQGNNTDKKSPAKKAAPAAKKPVEASKQVAKTDNKPAETKPAAKKEQAKKSTVKKPSTSKSPAKKTATDKK